MKGAKSKNSKDHRQYNKLFNKEYQGGLPRHIVREYERLQELYYGKVETNNLQRVRTTKRRKKNQGAA